jgi:hypothetical protein
MFAALSILPKFALTSGEHFSEGSRAAHGRPLTLQCLDHQVYTRLLWIQEQPLHTLLMDPFVDAVISLISQSS